MASADLAGGGADLAGGGGMMTLSSTAFGANGTIPQKYAHTMCGGTNASPPLAWSGAPSGTQAFALTVEDTTFPFSHWVAFDIDKGEGSLAEGLSGHATFHEAQNDYGGPGWGGPCPPPGETHAYSFTIFALDFQLTSTGLTETATLQDVKDKMAGHVLGQGNLVGNFKN